MPFKKEDLKQSHFAESKESVDEKMSDLSNANVKHLMINAIRFGTWLSFQAAHQDEAKKLGDGLWAKNFPDEKVPDDIKERLDDLIDRDTNKTFYDLIGNALRQEWGMADDTHIAGMVIEHMASETNAPAFANSVQETVKELAPFFNEGAKFFQLRMNTSSNHLN